ncbi:MAG: bifunctional phosphopantothenoylcysteine decarboxylase/phosphopantothenate--cysteine ligase CoaBC [Eubacteriales bacterium]
MLNGKKILVGVSGGIAAYKSVEIVSRLRKKGAEVYVVMTKSATEFVSPLTFRSLSGNPVHVDMFEEPKLWNIEHIALAEHVDVAIVAPATANIIAKMAVGIADDFLTTVLLAVRAKIFIAPAMNHAMYHHPATQANISVLKDRAVGFIGPVKGLQACGTEGDGRMTEPCDIVDELEKFFFLGHLFSGKKVIVTAGGTREALDPVRYIGNYSSGKMGYAVAQAFIEAGADVTLISTVDELPIPTGVEMVKVATAEEMYNNVLNRFAESDIVVKAAAVADYRPAKKVEHKMKKNGQNLILELVPNPDILAELGRNKTHQFLVGFAAETENVIENALEKLHRKNADMLIVNDVTRPGAGFGSDTNIVNILFADGRIKDLQKASKMNIAREIVKEIAILQNS